MRDKRGNDYPKRNEARRLRGVKVPALFFVVIVLSSCICGGGSPKVTMQYAIEYPSPSYTELTRLDTELGLERFTIARAFKGHGMIYSPKPFREDTYNYSRWIADPADMVGDHLLKDFRASGLFRAVFSNCDSATPRYVVQGGIEKIIETDHGDSSEAVLAVNVVLFDKGRTGSEERIVFQKNYRASAPVAKRTAEAFAAGASAAAEQLSKKIVVDVYEGIREEMSNKTTVSNDER